MTLDELKAAAERACRHYVECIEHKVYLTPAEERAYDLASFVRDLLSPGMCFMPNRVAAFIRQERLDNDGVRRLAADLLRCAERASESTSHGGER